MDKQIEKLAKELDYCETHDCIGESCAKCRAIWLIENGYRKIPEGSEVVDRKVLEMFQKDEERFREKAKFYYEKCKSYGIENFYDPELEEVDD